MCKACKTNVVHIKCDAYDVRIDRRTKWGNPFPMERESDRARVIADYRLDLWEKIKTGHFTLQELADLRGKRLACHCAPRPCHGDVLAAAAEWAWHKLYDKSA